MNIIAPSPAPLPVIIRERPRSEFRLGTGRNDLGDLVPVLLAMMQQTYAMDKERREEARSRAGRYLEKELPEYDRQYAEARTRFTKAHREALDRGNTAALPLQEEIRRLNRQGTDTSRMAWLDRLPERVQRAMEQQSGYYAASGYLQQTFAELAGFDTTGDPKVAEAWDTTQRRLAGLDRTHGAKAAQTSLEDYLTSKQEAYTRNRAALERQALDLWMERERRGIKQVAGSVDDYLADVRQLMQEQDTSKFSLRDAAPTSELKLAEAEWLPRPGYLTQMGRAITGAPQSFSEWAFGWDPKEYQTGPGKPIRPGAAVGPLEVGSATPEDLRMFASYGFDMTPFGGVIPQGQPTPAPVMAERSGSFGGFMGPSLEDLLYYIHAAGNPSMPPAARIMQ